jgi:hypothetical protein
MRRLRLRAARALRLLLTAIDRAYVAANLEREWARGIASETLEPADEGLNQRDQQDGTVWSGCDTF